MKLVVTGGAGFIGIFLVNSYLFSKMRNLLSMKMNIDEKINMLPNITKLPLNIDRGMLKYLSLLKYDIVWNPAINPIISRIVPGRVR